MKKILSLTAAFTTILSLTASEVTDTVSMAANYSNQIWYSLPNNEQGNSLTNNWDIAFQINGIASSILANTTKQGFKIYQSPYAVADWANVDTAGLETWSELHNSDTSWDNGALNTNPDGNTDLGWGSYDMNTHIITGDSIYVINLSNGNWIKFKVDQLASGTYSFSWANLDGSNAHTGNLKKSDYKDKLFAYFSIENNTVIDREPLLANWDLTFTKYTTTLFMPQPVPYSVTGVLQNNGVTAVKAYPVDVTTETHNNYSFGTEINILGYNWKKFDMSTSSYIIADSTVYFLQRKNGDVWKLIFNGFEGASNGNFIFTKALLHTQTVGIAAPENIKIIGVYPNPIHNQFNLTYTSNKKQHITLQIFDLLGKVVLEKEIPAQSGINQKNISTDELQPGVYLLSLEGNKTIKLIVQ